MSQAIYRYIYLDTEDYVCPKITIFFNKENEN